MKKAILISCALLLVSVSIFPFAAGMSTLSQGDSAAYQLTLTGNISETVSFIVSGYNTSNSMYEVREIIGNSASVVNASSSGIYGAFPIVRNATAGGMLQEVSDSPVNGYGRQKALFDNNTVNLSGRNGSTVTVPAGTFNAVRLAGSGFYSENGSYSYTNITAFVDPQTGLILILKVYVDSNGTRLFSYAELLNTNVAEKAVSGFNDTLVIASAGISVISVLAVMIWVQRKKKQ